MNHDRHTILTVLTLMIAALAVVASAGGLFVAAIYRGNAFVNTAFRGNDMVTLFAAVPLLLTALWFSRRGSLRWQLIWMGLIGYMLYNYAFYLYGADFNLFFLVYVALFTLSIYALVFGLSGFNASETARLFSPKTPGKWIGGWMFFFSLFLGGLWVMRSIGIMTTLATLTPGQIPQDIAQFGNPTAIVYATDLSLLVPALLLGACLLWQSKPWGYILSTVILIKACTYGLVMLVMSTYAFFMTGKGDDLMPLWIFLTMGCLVSAFFLLTSLREDKPVQTAAKAEAVGDLS